MMQDFVTLITNLGFPIAVCLMLMMYVKEITNKYQSDVKDFTSALNQNTMVLQKLCDRLDRERDKE